MAITKQQAQEGLGYIQREIGRLSKIQGAGAKLAAAQQIAALLEEIFNGKLENTRDAEHLLATYMKMPDVTASTGDAKDALKRVGAAGLKERFKNL